LRDTGKRRRTSQVLHTRPLLASPAVPRIALNALALRPGGSGVQTYIRELLRCLPDSVDAELVVRVQADAVGELPAQVRAVVVPPSAGARRAVQGLRGLNPSDLVHGLDVDLPARSRVPTVATIHDLSVFDVPWAFSRMRVAAERFVVTQSVRRADALIAVSGFTAERVHDRFGREATVIPLAPPPDFGPAEIDAVSDVRRRYGLTGPFVLHVGTIEPRKDVATLVTACRCIGADLVLAGAGAGAGAGDTGVVRRLGYVPRSDLPALYSAATVVAYPSRYEGFGLPPLEAMACGAAVVATRVGALPEVLANCAELVRPGDVDGLASALGGLLADSDRRSDLGQRGMRRAAEYRWAETAEATAAVYRRLGVG